MFTTRFVYIMLLGLTILTSCYYDKEELLYGAPAPCADTTGTISYTAKVVPILQASCYGCHSGGSPSGGQAMGTYSTDRAMALNGKLLGVITHANGFSPMPKGGAKLSNCNIAIVRKWIEAGAPNN
jgi:mono/diheme cytochrome c family protein